VSTNGANRKFSEPSRAVCAPRKALGWRSWWLFAILFCGRKSMTKKSIKNLNRFILQQNIVENIKRISPLIGLLKIAL